MIWAGGNAKIVLYSALIALGLGLIGNAALRMAGWSWWARAGVLIPVYAIAARMLYRLLNNSIIIM